MERDGGDEAQGAGAIGESADDADAALDLAVQPLQAVRSSCCSNLSSIASSSAFTIASASANGSPASPAPEYWSASAIPACCAAEFMGSNNRLPGRIAEVRGARARLTAVGGELWGQLEVDKHEGDDAIAVIRLERPHPPRAG